jgi:CrcB protein
LVVRYVWISVAGALGALTRDAISRAVGVTRFPWATLAINISGSFGLAVLFTVVMQRRVPTHLAAALSIGFFGAYTTFSTFSWETFNMSRTDRQPMAFTYVLVSIIGGLAAAWLGHIATRAIVSKG